MQTQLWGLALVLLHVSANIEMSTYYSDLEDFDDKSPLRSSYHNARDFFKNLIISHP